MTSKQNMTNLQPTNTPETWEKTYKYSEICCPMCGASTQWIKSLIESARREERKRTVEEIKYKFIGMWPNEKLMRGTISGQYTAKEVVELMFRLLDYLSQPNTK